MSQNADFKVEGDKFSEPGSVNPNKTIRKKDFMFYRDGTRWGILAGVGMALFLVVAQLMNFGDSIALKFFKYLALATVVAFALTVQRSYLNEEYNFRNGIRLGAYVTAISAITLVFMNVCLFLFTENLAFDKFSVLGDSFGNTMLISGVLFFEVLVFGMVTTFCVLQFIKPKRSGAEKPS